MAGAMFGLCLGEDKQKQIIYEITIFFFYFKPDSRRKKSHAFWYNFELIHIYICENLKSKIIKAYLK